MEFFLPFISFNTGIKGDPTSSSKTGVRSKEKGGEIKEEFYENATSEQYSKVLNADGIKAKAEETRTIWYQAKGAKGAKDESTMEVPKPKKLSTVDSLVKAGATDMWSE